MFGKSKKTVSVAYKEKLLAEIAHYDKRIEEALNKRRQNSFEDESFEDIKNPYKLKLQPSQYKLKQQEASLSDRASMTLELAMLTIMQSEVNVMVTPPEVRKPVAEDGVWHEVAAECKIDLISFTITFYAHKPYRKFAPTRYRNVAVELGKPSHQQELAQSILPKLQLPSLALQVLQSYASAFRSRRTTLLELAQRYEDKLKMQAMPEGGYRVRFLDLLQVDWTLENLWSPIVPFFHRMKFELEYMPKDYISSICRLYKQFKDPSLETPERTAILARIFDICLQAARPAREMQESFESDPETAGRLHERRTTIDQEPDVPRVQHSPKKPSGKENKAHNRKTDMAPPKTIPRKAKKSKPNQDNTSDSRKSVKRAMVGDNSNAKRPRNDDDSDNRAGLKGGANDRDETVGSNDDVQINGKQQGTKEKEVGLESSETKKTSKGKTVKATIENEAKDKDGKTVSNTENKHTNKDNDVCSKNSSEASSKVSKKNSDKTVKSKDVDTVTSTEKSKKGTEYSENTQKVSKDTAKHKEKNIEKNASEKDANTQIDKYNAKNTAKSKNKNMNKDSANYNTEAKNTNIKVVSSENGGINVESSKRVTKKAVGVKDVTSKVKTAESDVGISKSRNTYTKDNETEENTTNKKQVNETETISKAISKTVASKDDGKKKAPTNNVKPTNKVDTVSKKIPKTVEKDSDKATVGKTYSEKTNIDVDKKTKDNPQTKKVINKENVNVHKEVTKANNDKNKEAINVAINVVKAKQAKNTQLNTKANANNEKAERRENVKENPTLTEKNTDYDNKNTDKTFTKTVMNDEKPDRNDKVAQKRKTADPTNKNTEINDNHAKKSKADTEKLKANPKPSLNTTKTLKEKTNINEIEKNKITNKANKPKPKNLLNVTITKPKITPLSMPAGKQIKIADKLKTKIPMMKNKMSFAPLSGNVGRISAVEKSKIPQKSLPVFKKVVKNLPTRISPRKLPTIFKPSSQGYSNK